MIITPSSLSDRSVRLSWHSRNLLQEATKLNLFVFSYCGFQVWPLGCRNNEDNNTKECMKYCLNVNPLMAMQCMALVGLFVCLSVCLSVSFICAELRRTILIVTLVWYSRVVLDGGFGSSTVVLQLLRRSNF